MRSDERPGPIAVSSSSVGSSPPDPHHVADVFRRLLEENRIMTLATAATDGPWAAPVLYAWERGPVLYFMSRLGTRHVQDSLATGRAAAAIHPNATRPLRGIQLAGSIELLRGDEARRAVELYLDRFPLARARFPVEDVLAERGDIRFFALRPNRAFVLSQADFGWGVRQEVPLALVGGGRHSGTGAPHHLFGLLSRWTFSLVRLIRVRAGSRDSKVESRKSKVES